MKTIAYILFTLIIAPFSCDQQNNDQRDRADAGEYLTETILSGYEIIWGMDFFPNGDLIFTEKKGNVYIKSGENVTKLTGFPEVFDRKQGGLLDVQLHPHYPENGWIYSSYSAKSERGNGVLKLVRYKVDGNRIVSVEEIFSTDDNNSWYGHYGSRIVFDNENHLYLSIGEGGKVSYAGPDKKNNNAQELSSPWGKIHRLMDDGSIPVDNPVLDGKVPTSVWSYGHRNPQGLAMHPVTGELWSTEHGPRGGDEINIVRKGGNYGWPDYSLGVNYDGTVISKGHKAEGITEPVFSWDPSNGTCGIAFISGSQFKSFEGDLLVSGLVTKSVHRCLVKDGKVTEAEPLLSNVGRVRDVAQAPDGSIYVSVEQPGRIIRIVP